MAVRDLIIDIKSRFDEKGSKAAEEGLKKTEEAAKRSQRELERMERAAAKQRDAMESSGRTLATFGVAAVAGIGMAVKAAVDWESAWTGVTKTVEGTPQQLAALEGALRGLARELPASHKEIAAVAEAAGQLGVKRENITSFTRTMIALGQTTNLSAEQAATALARLSNIMGTPQAEIGKLGASLVALGNAGASTESEIVDMALRIAGAGKTIGLTEGQVLGFSSALSSVGINAEAGGSSISRVMITIAQAVDAGGQQVEKFAKVAGMSASEFSTAFKQDAGGALAAFIEGLGKVESSGGSLFQTLQQLGFSEVEVRDALLRTANAGSLLSDSLRVGERAWADNSALVEEAAKRYETTASKMQVAQNNVTDLAITIGQTFLPILGQVAEHTSGWIAMLSDLPAPVKTAGTVVGGLAGTVALAGGAAMIAVPKMVEFTKTLTEMGPRGAALAGRLSSLGSFLTGPWGLALGAAAGVLLLFADAQAETAGRVEDLTQAIVADHGAIADSTREKILNNLVSDGMIAQAKQLGLNLDLVTRAFGGNKDAASLLNQQLDDMLAKKMDQAPAFAWPWDEAGRKIKDETDAITGLKFSLGEYGRQLDAAKGKAQEQIDVQDKQVVKVTDLESAMQGMTAEMSGQGVAAGDLSGFMQGLASAYGLVGDDAAKAAQKMIDSWSQAFSQFGNLVGAIQDIESSASQSSTSNADRQAAAVQRLAEVQRDGAEKIKRAQRDLADAHRTSTEKITKAQRDLADAHEKAADRTVQSQERIRSAQQSLADAIEQAAQRGAAALQRVEDAQRHVAEVAQDSSRKIGSAAQRVADAQTEAAQRQLDAERRLQDSHARTAQAVEDLTAARVHAQQRLEDLARSEASSALDEEGAQIAIERAQQRLDELGAPDSKATDLDRREADLAYRRAKDRLKEIQQRNADLRKEIADANRAGVEGSAEVVKAKERIAQAQQAEQEAEAALAKAREDGARSVAAAEQALADARSDAARQQEEAQRALAKAEAELDQSRTASAKDVLKAKQDIVDAEKAAAKATRDAARDVQDAEQAVRDAHRKTARDVQDAQEAVRAARQAAARDEVKANQDVRDSWVNLGGTVAVTTDQYLRELEKQVKDQEKWADNLISLAGRVPGAMLDELIKLGPGGAKVVAMASQMSDVELKKFIELHGRSGKLAGDTFAENLATAGPILRYIALTRGQEVADKVREGMDGGRTSVFEAAKRIGLDIITGIGKDHTITIFVKTEYQDDLSREALRMAVQNREAGGIDRYAAGGIERYAMGGLRRPAGPTIAGRPTVLFGEGKGDEAFIPYDQQYRARAEGLLSQVAGDFGGVFLKPLGAPAGGGDGGSAMAMGRGGNTYNITVQVPPGGDLAAAGAVTVKAIQAYESRSGSSWRRTP
ncbi:phage tail tape measure protein [Sphaerisporangium sp. NBC_01403]|uniref:phage tail tape measure protein n=1 Tax=Sphaerisporangium sp. NBC_01403 TaxID=2903599 RepID=UPI00324A95B6